MGVFASLDARQTCCSKSLSSQTSVLCPFWGLWVTPNVPTLQRGLFQEVGATWSAQRQDSRDGKAPGEQHWLPAPAAGTRDKVQADFLCLSNAGRSLRPTCQVGRVDTWGGGGRTHLFLRGSAGDQVDGQPRLSGARQEGAS